MLLKKWFGRILMSSFKLRAPTGPLQRGPVLGRLTLSTEALCLLFFPSSSPVQSSACAHHHVYLSAHMIQFPVKASFLGKRKAQSHFGNPGTWTAESHFLGPRVHSDLVNLLERLASFSFLVFFSFFSCPSRLLSLSLWGTFQRRSPTQTLTQALCSYFSPNAQNTLIFQAVSSVGQVDHRHPLIQTAAVSAESVHFVQRRVLPQ